MFAVKKMCHPQKYVTRIDCDPITSSRNDWQSYLQYPFIRWDPLAQFPYLFNTQSFLCPTCLEDAEKTDKKTHSFLSRTNHWFNGRLKRYNPRLFYHTNSCILLVSCMYRCSKGHEVSSCHPSILSSFPSSYLFQIPFCLFHKCGFTKDALHLVQKLVDEGLTFEQIERLLELQYRDSFSIMELTFWGDYRLRSSQRIQENTNKFCFPSFSNQVFPHPSNDILIDLYVAGFKLQEHCFAQAMSRLLARWISCDHTFKSVANIGYKRPSDGKWKKIVQFRFLHFERKGRGFAMAIYTIRKL